MHVSPGLEKSKLQRGVQLSAAKFPKTIVLSHTGCGRIHEAAAKTQRSPCKNCIDHKEHDEQGMQICWLATASKAKCSSSICNFLDLAIQAEAAQVSGVQEPQEQRRSPHRDMKNDEGMSPDQFNSRVWRIGASLPALLCIDFLQA